MDSAKASQPEGAGKWTGEIWGGFASMLVALPSSIAFGIAIYVVLGQEYLAYGVLSGILGAIAMGLVAPCFGGAPRLVSAPCAPAAAVMGALAAELLKSSGASPHLIVALLTITGALCGALQILFGALRGGKMIKFIPYPVVSGYLSAVGILILLSQIPKFLGTPKNLDLWPALTDFSQWQWPGIIVGLCTIVGMLAAPRLTRKVPATIIGLGAGLLSYGVLAFFLPELRHLTHNKLVIGPLFEGGSSLFSSLGERFKGLSDLRLGDLKLIIMPALTLSVLLSIDTLKTCIVLDNLTRSRHDSNRELVGQGLANLASGLIGGLPGAGTMGATLVNLNSGGQTRRSGILEGVFVVLAFLLLGKVIGWIPIAALAGILMVIGCRMVDRQTFHLLKQKATILDFVVIVAVVFVAIEVNLIAATGTGLALAMFLFIREQVRGSVVRRKLYGNRISSKQYRLPEAKEVMEQYGDSTVVVELQGSLFFGTTDKLYTELEPDLKRCRHVILDMRRVQTVDFTATHLLELIADTLSERGGHLIFSSLPPNLPTGQDLESYFGEVGLSSSAHAIKIFESLDAALEWTEDQLLEEHRLLAKGQEYPLELPEMELLREFESDDVLSALKSCVEQRAYREGETIFKKGDSGDELFLIRRGIVRVLLPLENNRRHLLATFARGNFFGEIAFLDRGQRSADAVADTATDLFLISRSRVDELAKQHPVLGIKLFARLARGLAVRLRYTDSELRALKES